MSAKNLESVSKIVLSVIVPVRTGGPRIKISPIPAGIKCVVRGKNAQQDFFIYTREATIVSGCLEKVWNRR